MNTKNLFPLALRLIAAIILLQTLFFKFSAHPQSVELFTKLGVEPWGRVGTGVIELITGILLLVPATAFIGGVLAIGLMVGAIGSHIAIIGIESHGDGGLLFIMAVTVFLCGIAIAYIYRQQGFDLLKKIGR
jgi:putative oxidoreductase